MRIRLAILATAAAFLPASASAETAESVLLTAQGRIEDGDRHEGAAGPALYDEHRLRLEAGRRYRISASSEDIDTYIQLFQQGENEPVAENDDYNPDENLNSRLTYTPEESDDYVLRVRSFMEEGRGPYEIRVEALPPLPAPIAGRATEAARTRWQIWSGELSEADAEQDGAYFDDYLVAMRAGETRLISAEAEGFDPMVWVLRADAREGEPLDIDDDAGPWTNALLGFQPEEDGDYLVRVTSLGTGAGAYRLRISEPLTPPPPGPPAEPSAESGD